MGIFRWTAIPIFLLFFVSGLSGIVSAEDEVGKVVAVRGKAVIYRDKETIKAEANDNIFLIDTVSTMEASKAKMLFIDDSVLTLGENSKLVIKEFVYSKDKGGRSIFNLIDGKMRSIVGKTKFEVHTPTAVAAARGTVILIDTGVINGKKFTTFICLEGDVFLMSAYATVTGSLLLKPGMMVTLFEGEPLPPDTMKAPPDKIKSILSSTDVGHEISVPGPAEIRTGPEGFVIEPPPVISLPDQQPSDTGNTNVNIDVIFPDK
ncbi:MAG: hypothetical protein A2Y97_04600 [Nitrospirae bacterium RBG_13_39_12]|nr:MAG: hypothetical protein A2Y97_04600 [Nitrospirae bacterium RBG_13_39_12]